MNSAREVIAAAPKKNLGTAVVEMTGDGLMLMLPDGDIRGVADAAAAKKIIEAWCRKRTPKDGLAVCVVDWRGVAPPPAK